MRHLIADFDAGPKSASGKSAEVSQRVPTNTWVSVEIVGSNIHFADLQWANDVRLHREYIFLVLKPALDQQEFAVGDNAAVRVIPPPLAASRPRFRQNPWQTSGFESTRFIFYSRTEKLSGSSRVLFHNRHRLAPPRRDHVVDSTSVWFPIWADVSQYERCLLPPWW
jgi:hypothetical protein